MNNLQWRRQYSLAAPKQTLRKNIPQIKRHDDSDEQTPASTNKLRTQRRIQRPMPGFAGEVGHRKGTTARKQTQRQFSLWHTVTDRKICHTHTHTHTHTEWEWDRQRETDRQTERRRQTNGDRQKQRQITDICLYSLWTGEVLRIDVSKLFGCHRHCFKSQLTSCPKTVRFLSTYCANQYSVSETKTVLFLQTPYLY